MGPPPEALLYKNSQALNKLVPLVRKRKNPPRQPPLP